MCTPYTDPACGDQACMWNGMNQHFGSMEPVAETRPDDEQIPRIYNAEY